MSHLRYLQLDLTYRTVDLTGGILEHLLELFPQLTTLSLAEFKGKSDFFERLRPIMNAKQISMHMDFSSWGPDDAALVEFLRMSTDRLQELQLDCGELSRDVYAAISGCTKLRRLFLSFGKPLPFTDDVMKTLLVNLPDLEALEITFFDSLTDEGFAPILKRKKLRTLNLAFCKGITKRFLRSLGSIRTLEELELTCVRIDKSVLRGLARLKHLRKLVIESQNMNSVWFGTICENFTGLRELSLRGVEKLTDADGMKLCRLKELTTLRFEGGYGFTDKTFVNGVGSPTMSFLDLCGCSLTDNGLASIAARHGHLKTLYLLSCKKITGAGLVALLQREPKLELLHIERCDSLGDEWIAEMENLCPRLRRLSVQCPVRFHVAVRFARRRPSIEVYL